MANSTQQATELTTMNVPVGKSDLHLPRCTFCGRKIKNNPVTRFMRHGIEFLDDGDKAHKGCCFSQYEKVKEILIQMDS